MELASTSAVIAAAKDSLSLKLDTPFMLSASLIGWVCVLGSRDDRTPLQSIARLFVWAGWQAGAIWVEPTRTWLTAPQRIELVALAFWLLTVAGVAYAAYGTRPPFFALLGIGGMLETSTSAAIWGCRWQRSSLPASWAEYETETTWDIAGSTAR